MFKLMLHYWMTVKLTLKHFSDKKGHVWVCDGVQASKGIKYHREKDFACFRSCTPGFTLSHCIFYLERDFLQHKEFNPMYHGHENIHINLYYRHCVNQVYWLWLNIHPEPCENLQ